MLEQFIIASRDPGKSVDLTLKAVEKALRSVPGSRVVSVDQKTGVVVVEIPSSEVNRVRTELGSGFMFDSNSGLRY